MQQLISPNQSLVGIFSDLSSAEATRKSLEATEFSGGLSVLPRALRPNPPVRDTEAQRSAGGGAIAGAAFGGLAGLLLGGMTLLAETPEITLWQTVAGITLAGSGVGAAGGGLWGALTGLKVHKTATSDSIEASDYVLVASDVSEAELTRARQVAQQHGGRLEA